MNIDDALLMRRTLETLTGSTGKTHAQLAHAVHVSQRRMTHMLFCLEKVGLVTTHANGLVTLADAFAETVWRHTHELTTAKAGANIDQKAWLRQRRAQAHHEKIQGERLNAVFNEIFGRQG